MNIQVRPLTLEKLPDAERIVRLAFATKLGIQDPDNWRQGTSLRGRLLAEPRGVFGAFDGIEMVGAIFSITWGSFGFFGPLVVHPNAWGNGVAQQLLDPVMELFKRNVGHEALFTFSDSPMHIALYQKFGYWPRFLTALMKKEVWSQERQNRLSTALDLQSNKTVHRFSQLSDSQKREFLPEARELTGTIYDGLDVTKEILPVDELSIGDTLVLRTDGKLTGFAVCHYGQGSEADQGSCYIKFAAVRSGPDATTTFSEMLTACSKYAVKAGARVITAGMNTAREWAYSTMRSNGFRAQNFGVAMHKPNEPAYDRSDVFVIDDWR